MSNRKLGILAVVAAVMVTLAVVQSRKPPGQAGPAGPSYLIQGLDTAQISGITIGAGKNVVKIEKQNDRFVVTNKSNYPADTKQINDLIGKCLDIKTSELRTDKPGNHADLEVTEEKARYVVKFLKGDNAVLTGVVVGKSLDGGQGTFVRRVDSNDVYVTDNAPYFGTTPMDFIAAEIFPAKREDVNSVTVTTPEGSYTLKAGRSSDSVAMENLPADKTLKESEARSVFQSLVSLRFDDVNAPSALGDLKFDHQFVCRLNNTAEYTLKLAKKDGKTYMRCEAVYTGTSGVTMTKGKVESDEELKKKEEKLKAEENVLRFNPLHKNWVYVLPDWKANYLMKKQADLLEDKAKPADPNVTAARPVVTPAPTTAPKAAEPNAPKPAEPNQA